MQEASQNNNDDISRPPHTIQSVAIIGAGLSGIVSAVHLLHAGLDITIFERGDSVGGAWKYNPRPDHDPPFPCIHPPAPDWSGLERLQGRGLSAEEATVRFSPPGPVYTNMKSRGNKTAMRTSLLDWPEGSGDPLDHSEVLRYLEDVARLCYLEEKVRFRMRVESVSKNAVDDKWEVRTSKLITDNTGFRLERETSSFDAIVVASGRYGVPRVPDVPGLDVWKRMFPNRIITSNQYRTPEPFKDQRVLVIGAFISASEITKALVDNGAIVLQSALDTRVDLRDQINHESAIKVAMAVKFETFPQHEDRSLQAGAESALQSLDDLDPIPGVVHLSDGQVLENIHHIIIATGYLTTYPFLGPVLEQPSTPPEMASDQVIITSDGRTVHNLHEDIFYIPDPTLAFIGVTQFASTFSLYDFQAQVLAVVFAGRVRLPSEAEMKAEQARRKKRLLKGTLLNSIFLCDDFVVRRLMGWVNRDLVAGGFEPLPGPDEKYWEALREQREGSKGRLGVLQDNYLGKHT